MNKNKYSRISVEERFQLAHQRETEPSQPHRDGHARAEHRQAQLYSLRRGPQPLRGLAIERRERAHRQRGSEYKRAQI